MPRILVIRGGAIGDFILTIPAIRLLRDQLPDAHIEILGYPAITELAKESGIADAVRSIEYAGLANFFNPSTVLDPDLMDYFASFNLVVSYLFDPDGFFAGNLERAGVKTLLTGPFRPEDSDPALPAAIQLAKPLERFALFLETGEMTLDYGRTVTSPLPRSESKCRIAIHPGSGSPSKNWSFESWVEVLSHLHRRIESVEIVVTHGEAEHEVIGEFLALLEKADLPFESLSGRSLAELGAFFGEIDFYLGHDSGISHLAASAGAEGLLLFGPTNPDVWSPVSPRMRNLVAGGVSLGSITVEDVLEELESWSSSQPNRRELI